MPIHPLAVVDAAAVIDPSATIGPFAMVGAGVTIGKNVEIRSHAVIHGRSSIDAESIIFSGAVIGTDPQDLKFRGEDSEVLIGRRCRIHEYATISKGTAGGGMKTVVGDETLVMAYAHIAHDCILDGQNVVGNASQLAGHVRLERKAIVSGMTGVHHFVTVGEYAFVGGMSGVRIDVPPFLMAEGNPAKPINVNVVGLRRANFTEEEVEGLRESFRQLFKDRAGTPLAEVLGKIRSSSIHDVSCVQRLCDWLEHQANNSHKGRMQESSRH